MTDPYRACEEAERRLLDSRSRKPKLMDIPRVPRLSDAGWTVFCCGLAVIVSLISIAIALSR